MSYAHELCGSKLRSKLGSSLNESASQGISSDSFAARQMAKMGWVEGTGLGKGRNGVKTHIKVTKREENVGLGKEKELAIEMSNTWWKNSVSSTLERLQQANKKNKKNDSKKSKKKSKRNYTDEELFEATGGARFGMRAQRRAEGKWKRTEGISLETEIETKKKMEWNGLGEAKLILPSTKPITVSAHESEVGSSRNNSEEERAHITLTSKKRKRNKSTEILEDTNIVKKKILKKESKSTKNENITPIKRPENFQKKKIEKKEKKSKKSDKKKSKKKR